MSDPKDNPPGSNKPEGAEVVPIEEARKRSEDKTAAAPAEAKPVNPAAAAFLTPVMEALARELAGLATPDGQIKLGGDAEAAKAKTAAVVRALGIGLGAALADAIGKFADKLDLKVTLPTDVKVTLPTDKPETPPAPAPAPGVTPPDKKPDSNN
jgi:hypothetical protein